MAGQKYGKFNWWDVDILIVDYVEDAGLENVQILG